MTWKVERWGDEGMLISQELPDPFRDIPALAERLGVPEGGGSNSIVLRLHDGRSYNFIALINAVLDKLDAVSKNL